MSFVDTLKQSVNNYIDEVARKRLDDNVQAVMHEREELKGWTERELKLATLAFKEDLQKGKELDKIIVPAFSVANEVARRVLKKYPYEVQILAGLVIHGGRIAEMKAGEGKTLTETMPVYLNALAGKGVHIITTNDYLAERDAKAMGELYNFLGLSVGFVTSDMKNDDRRKAYAADITYVTNQEIGFDFLRDNLVYVKSERVLRAEHPLNFGIVDEIDSILIDESRTPLIIAEPVKEGRQLYDLFTKVVNRLEEEKDFIVDYKNKNITVTNKGLDHVEQLLGSPVFSKDNPMYVFYLDVCLKANIIFEKNRDYIISNGGVEIVDEFTGRVLPGRRFTDGVHQAIEAKEKLKVKESDRTQAAITFQNFFPMYEKLSGMSGTVMGARDEFNSVYKLDVVQIPTNKPTIRKDHNDLFFKTEKGKFLGLVKKIHEVHTKQQPLLIGSRNVEVAHKVAAILEQEGLPYQLLTAQDNKSESQKIAQAGQPGMITVATNMAGRGTDILLGEGVAFKGGLYMIGTERHESRRIDDQLVGRAGRQGVPGESQFLISMEDEIIQLFGSEHIIDVMEEYDIPEDEYISGKGLDEAFKKAQDFIESKNYDSRIYLYKYDRVVNFQRAETYALRDRLLENEPEFKNFFLVSIAETVQRIFLLGDPAMVGNKFRDIFNIEIGPQELAKEGLSAHADQSSGSLRHMKERFTAYLTNSALQIEQEPEVYEAAQKLILNIIDTNWSNHLELMDILKEEANLFSYASPEPLIDFIKESGSLFREMNYLIQEQFLHSLFLHLSQRGMLK
jgi:preprotein translocase subunit SecA